MTLPCYTLDEQEWGRLLPTVLRKHELVSVGRREQTKTRSLSSSGPAAAHWTEAVETQIAKLLELPENWDSYGASRVRFDAVDEMLKVLRDVMGPTTPAPTMVPSADGHLQAEWHTHGVDLEVEVIDTLQIDVSYSGPGGPWHETLDLDLERLTTAIDKLSRTR
jgi:hypothetical protein